MTEPKEYAAVDSAILACNGSSDIQLQRGFLQHDHTQTRYTVSHEARRGLLRRLLELTLGQQAR